MTYDIYQQHRKDINKLSDTNISTAIDLLHNATSPLPIVPDDYEGTLWILENSNTAQYDSTIYSTVQQKLTADSTLTKHCLVENDTITFIIHPHKEFEYKNITAIDCSFHYQIQQHQHHSTAQYNTAENEAYATITNIILETADITSTLEINEKIEKEEDDIYIEGSKFGFITEDLNNAIQQQGFNIKILFNTVSYNTNIKITNIRIHLHYTEKLQEEIQAIQNRIT